MTDNELQKLRESYDVALISLCKNRHMQCAVKGSVPELIALMGMMMVDIHKQSGVDLKELGIALNDVVSREMAAREKKN
jgi:hypothetical protein